MHSSPPSRNWAASSRSQHQRSTRCLRWYRNVAGRLDSTAMMRSAKPGLSSAKSDIAAGGARLTARMGGQSVLTKFRAPANVRFAPPQADVPEKSAFDLDRAKTSSEGRPAWGPDLGII